MRAQDRQVEQREQPHRSVSALIADDGLHARVVDHGLQIRGALEVGSGEVGLFAVGEVTPVFHVQSPAFEPLPDAGRVGPFAELARRGDDAHGVARPQVGRTDEGASGVRVGAAALRAGTSESAALSGCGTGMPAGTSADGPAALPAVRRKRARRRRKRRVMAVAVDRCRVRSGFPAPYAGSVQSPCSRISSTSRSSASSCGMLRAITSRPL